MSQDKCECETGERTPMNCWSCSRNPGPVLDIDVLHKARPSDPGQPVLVAGDPEMATREERLRDGVPVPDDLMEQLRAVAAAANVAFVLAP